MLALLGWNPGTEQEIFSLEELTELFSLERVNKSGARFDPEKTKWFNQQHLLKKSDPAFMEELSAKLSAVEEWKADKIKETIAALIEEKGLGFGLVMNALRLALVGGGFGPDLMTIAEMIGKEETVTRIKNAVERL